MISAILIRQVKSHTKKKNGLNKLPIYHFLRTATKNVLAANFAESYCSWCDSPGPVLYNMSHLLLKRWNSLVNDTHYHNNPGGMVASQ